MMTKQTKNGAKGHRAKARKSATGKPDPLRSDAAKRAWITIRANRAEPKTSKTRPNVIHCGPMKKAA